ncbi:metallophosphoesterase family protein, partial [Vibrio parahaemolyticus]|uniref:metallophosphoesterase family protein n=1 Tax=Vibrio parahaemolyticus TaxID=670 RepID=UPI00211316DD
RPPLLEVYIIAHGHTHVPVSEMKDGVVIFKPGSITFPRNVLQRSFVLLDVNIISVHTTEFELLAHKKI